MTSQEMMKHTCKKGNIMWNVAPRGEKPDWVEQPAPPGWFEGEGDPNHRSNDLHIFGYHYKDFMRRQYK